MIQLNFEKNDGFVTVVTVCAMTKDVLMVAHMNEEAWLQTLESGYATYWSRTRNCLWKKGETSGNLQHVQSIRVDCDLDAAILFVTQEGDACHTGFRSCFFRSVDRNGLLELDPGSALMQRRSMSEKQRQLCLSQEIL